MRLIFLVSCKDECLFLYVDSCAVFDIRLTGNLKRKVLVGEISALKKESDVQLRNHAIQIFYLVMVHSEPKHIRRNKKNKMNR